MVLFDVLKRSPSDTFETMWGSPELHDQNWLSWDPYTLIASVGLSGASELEQDKVIATQHVGYNTNEVCTSVNTFYTVVSAFNNEPFITSGVAPMQIEEIFYAVQHMKNIVAIVHGKVPMEFYGEIPGYVAACAKYHGWVLLPADLGFAQDALDHLTGVFSDQDRLEQNKRVLVDTVDFIKTVTPTNIPKDLLTSDTPETILRRRIIGAYLYDPTLIRS